MIDSGTPRLILGGNRLMRGAEGDSQGADVLIQTASGSEHATRLRSSKVALGTEDLGPRTVVVYAKPFSGFDGLLGLAGMGFRRVCFDFENGLFRWD